MEAKLKAEELVQKYYDLIHPKVNSYYQAKQCALIAVDEIIKVLNSDINPLVNYWYEVKQEIEKL